MIGLLALTIVCSIMLYLFAGYHMFLIYNGYTTNEKIKTSNLKYFLGKLENFLQKWIKIREENVENVGEPKARSLEYYGCKADLTTV